MSSPLPQLKPMTAGDILDQAIRLYRQNFVGLVTIVAVVSLPLILIQALGAALAFPFTGNLNSIPPDLDFSSIAIVFGIVYLIFLLIAGVMGVIELGALTSFVSERFLGRPITVRQAYRNAFRRGLSLFLAAILLFLAFIGTFGLLFVVAFLPVFLGVFALGSDSGASSAIAGLGVLCACLLFIPTIVGGIFLYTRWVFWTQAIMIENYNSTGGLGRSWKLVKGNFWRVLGFNLLLGILVYFVTVGPTTALTLGAAFFPSPILQFVAQSVLGGIISIIVSPLQIATLTVLYYDLRIRREGLDLQMQMQEPTTDLPSLIPGTTG